MNNSKLIPFRAVYNDARREYEIFGGPEVEHPTDQELLDGDYVCDCVYLFTIKEDALDKEFARELVDTIINAVKSL